MLLKETNKNKDKNPLTKQDLFDYFKDLSKEYKKISNRMPIQVIIVGGASVLLNYGFRESTMDIDAFYGFSDAFKQAMINVSDKYNYRYDLLNDSFKFTDSFSNKLVMYSTYYKTFSNVMEIRTIKAEYLIAMKLTASRDYKYDISDAVGILAMEKANGNIITIDKIKQAVIDLYGDWDIVRKESQIFIENELKNDNLEERYKQLYSKENQVRDDVIFNLNSRKLPHNESNVKKFIELAKKKQKEGK